MAALPAGCTLELCAVSIAMVSCAVSIASCHDYTVGRGLYWLGVPHAIKLIVFMPAAICLLSRGLRMLMLPHSLPKAVFALAPGVSAAPLPLP